MKKQKLEVRRFGVCPALGARVDLIVSCRGRCCGRGRPHSKGVALVITLLMLSVITFMAIAFLAVSRRERASVAGTLDQVDAQAMADAGLARAQADVVAYLMANNTNAPAGRGRPNDLLNYDLMMSHNFINPYGFDTASGNQFVRTNVTNVSYTYPNGAALSPDDQVQNIANLLYDPRPPVYVQTNTSSPNLDFRYWLDYNRNGRFESNGVVAVMDDLGNTNGQVELDYGEPEWIGTLRQPDATHSGTNPFIGRYAYLVLPIGKTLDLNFIHNYAKATASRFPANMPFDGYMRNQGHGPWELNLAALLAGLNSNLWATDYVYKVNTGVSSLGIAFQDALSFLRFRYNNANTYLLPLSTVFPNNGNPFLFQTDNIDEYSDGSIETNLFASFADSPQADNPNAPWPGSTNYNNFYEPQDIFTKLAGTPFASRLTNALNQIDTTNRYTFSRLLASIGTDSDPELYCWVHGDDGTLVKRGKVNINFDNSAQIQSFNRDPNHNRLTTPAGLTNWAALSFFTNAAELLLRSQDFAIITNDSVLDTNIPPGIGYVHFGVTNILVYSSANTNIHYSASIHRMLQLAANIYDATDSTNYDAATGIMYPSVFRPQFSTVVTNDPNYFMRRAATNVYITNWVAVTDTNFVRNPFRSLSQIGPGIAPDDNVWGVPLVVGARKNLPNFNKFAFVTAFDITRKLKYIRASATPGVKPDGYQMTLMSISNVFGVEAWNSYTMTAFPRAVNLYLTNAGTVTFANEQTDRVAGYTNVVGQTIGANGWPGNYLPKYSALSSTTVNSNSFKTFATNLIALPEAQYSEAKQQFEFNPVDTNWVVNSQYKNSFPVHDWNIWTTNYVFYLLTDQQTGRILDVVNIGDFYNHFNINSNLQNKGIPPTQNIWNTNVLAGDPNPNMKVGVWKQLDIATNGGDGVAVPGEYTPQPGAGSEFAAFLQGQGTNLAKDCPYQPSVTLQFKTYYETTDPLVHYTLDDLSPPPLTNEVTYLQPRMATNAMLTDLGRMNQMYSPWNYGNSYPDVIVNMTFKDPMVQQPADWDFPTNKFPSVGRLGRVHRGSPWQTVYLKSEAVNPTMIPKDHNNWVHEWEKDLTSYPTNDWRILDLFTVAVNENAARGLLSINQTNLAPWSALLSGVYVLSNNNSGTVIDPTNVPPLLAEINADRAKQDNGVFHHLGDFLAATNLTRASSFVISPDAPSLKTTNSFRWDEVVERIPQQVLSLVKLGDPRFVIYSFGQSLKPANNSLVLGGPYRGMCTNYMITGEVVTRAVCRLSNDSSPSNPKIVVESFNILPGN